MQSTAFIGSTLNSAGDNITQNQSFCIGEQPWAHHRPHDSVSYLCAEDSKHIFNVQGTSCEPQYSCSFSHNQSKYWNSNEMPVAQTSDSYGQINEHHTETEVNPYEQAPTSFYCRTESAPSCLDYARVILHRESNDPFTYSGLTVPTAEVTRTCSAPLPTTISTPPSKRQSIDDFLALERPQRRSIRDFLTQLSEDLMAGAQHPPSPASAPTVRQARYQLLPQPSHPPPPPQLPAGLQFQCAAPTAAPAQPQRA